MTRNNLNTAILELYHVATQKESSTLNSIAHEFSVMKIYEPLVHSSNIFGKVHTNHHILEDEIEESPFLQF